RYGREPSSDKQIPAAGSETGRHAAIHVIADTADARKSGAGRADNSELRIVVIGADRGNGIGVGVTLKARAKVKQHRRRDGVVEIQPRHPAVDRLYAYR